MLPSTARAAIYLLVATAAACGDDDRHLPMAPIDVAQDEENEERGETVERPPLSRTPTGPDHGDARLTLERCVVTAWSYHGCETAFPEQGRRWLAEQCTTPSAAYPPGDPRDRGELGGPSGYSAALAGPMSPQERSAFRQTVCGRSATYRLRGIGGPVERAEGLAQLRRVCDEGAKAVCSDLAMEHLWAGELDRARALFGRACDDPEESSPIGTCQTLSHALAPNGYYRWRITEAETEGGVVEAGARCELVVVRPVGPAFGSRVGVDRSRCEGRVRCGDAVLYGRGGSVFPCELVGDQVTGGESMQTREDGDPALSFDERDGRFRLADDASGPLGAFRVDGRLERIPTGAAAGTEGRTRDR
ncbi:MAG TPA: hypothetical protein RMH99_07045 [Sandaracinaceae bacterium LLY-WYZ-13_1]|nr:hypothetical protein [Sandaracinaceae bacterium LLY-WYZ-13_1]